MFATWAFHTFISSEKRTSLTQGIDAPRKRFERNRFESSQATRFNRTMGRYVGWLA
jgi:hypothetical protein